MSLLILFIIATVCINLNTAEEANAKKKWNHKCDPSLEHKALFNQCLSERKGDGIENHYFKLDIEDKKAIEKCALIYEGVISPDTHMFNMEKAHKVIDEFTSSSEVKDNLKTIVEECADQYDVAKDAKEIFDCLRPKFHDICDYSFSVL